MATPDELMLAARKARSRAYAPYSGFSVGAALEVAGGTVITGCNVENASYGLSLCAERAAVVRAVSRGKRAFRALAIAGPDGIETAPCGACRQFIAEFAPALPIMFTGVDGVIQTTLAELLPHAFRTLV